MTSEFLVIFYVEDQIIRQTTDEKWAAFSIFNNLYCGVEKAYGCFIIDKLLMDFQLFASLVKHSAETRLMAD